MGLVLAHESFSRSACVEARQTRGGKKRAGPHPSSPRTLPVRTGERGTSESRANVYIGGSHERGGGL
ncbi:uncharacterized protein CC84DRAFT_518360 [Paraphaeosphaeria sporulosa]|uniref:Uncharacterized protein n=1 Tax=Paraphaeosphaeria sporulosa TaxID=1460663 RepID=A0A177CU47_9PLEO|nr:uncharacterized protein CC84DRAFT_518360 [Paraphaeosphaeria sporulosa]OAG11065.1 hypothetical protein CC84DRAFT_518360 [Paraphaeosphaeria sporulosa]